MLMKRSVFAGALVLGAAIGCAPAPREQGPNESRPAAIDPSPSPAARDVAQLIVERKDGELRVISAARVPAASLGPAATWNGAGPVTHRYRLIGATGVTLAEGEISASLAHHIAPGPAGPAAHAAPGSEEEVFRVRAPHPTAGEHLEIEAIATSGSDGNAAREKVIWP